ncbi:MULTISPECIES: pentapeptide repeat-containing protein [Cyanophyceae]|uniref:pentapeptide repeat-containing protein n=1 Tax=Cyanophyceae TaxID=3028117 RepID=UPI001689E2EE|nr:MULTISPECIES: pentapeptide repeat-containing protein [Cyanophyceae]MBD1917986.1 pentapeptide repeat-containing protein [Phormidium sp. FACHB-77]MBD2029234.1 pentapeptide repeat-containing protein [Phormidium sp. FACHB-322]MBD2049766.1 pentapeptide repeat-containing protein [Leptolyngbya sp. FACHB-60]
MAYKELVALLNQGSKTWNAWRKKNPDIKVDLSSANLSSADLIAADLSGANLLGANLSDANFYSANFRSAILMGADLSFIGLRFADITSANLISANFRYADLIDTDLTCANLSAADLIGANLSGANLSGANLNGSQVLHTNFTQATLTGACIADWQISSSTILENIKCDYVFRTYDDEKQQYSGRLPVDVESTFAPGEFAQRFQIIASALETIDITFTEGIDWKAFFQSFQELRQRYPQQDIGIQGIEEKEGALIVRLKVEAEETGVELEQLKGHIETTEKQLYSVQLSLREAEGQLKVYREMMGVVQTLALRPMGDQNFYAPVGNVAGTNQGQMTAYINQNNEAISQLIAALRTSAQTFPPEQKDDVLMELDDLEGDLNKPEKQEPKRIGKRLQRLIAAGAATTTLAGGAATFAGNVNDFTANVLDLGEKIGLTRDMIQP